MDDVESQISDWSILERWEQKAEEGLARGTGMFMGTCPKVWAHHCGSRGRESDAEAGGKIICIADHWSRISLQIWE